MEPRLRRAQRSAVARRAPVAAALAAATTALLLAVGAGSAGAHTGPVDATNGHFCTGPESQNNLCAPAGSYHTHSAQGNMILATPPPGATPGAAATPPPTVVVAGAPQPQPVNPVVVAAPPATPPPTQMARTGRASRELALGGLLVAVLGSLLLFGNRAVPMPALLELDRPRRIPPR